MSRQSLLHKIISTIDGSSKDVKFSRENLYLIVYDFNIDKINRIPEKFYINLKKIRKIFNDGYFIQKSVIECRNYKVAKIILKLAKHYGANVYLFEAKKLLE